MIPYGRQSVSPADVDAVCSVLGSDYLTTGPLVVEFERRFAQTVGAKHAIAVCNGTAALHLAMLVAGIGPGDRVVTTPNTFLASANCAAYVGAVPDFCDIDSVSYNLCPKALAENWMPDTKAVVAVDYAGQSADMPAIAEVARSRGGVVVEDACHAVGGAFERDGQVWRVGGHPWADITTFSFHPVKTMTTGEGGMLVTDNDEYADRARTLRTHGILRDSDRFTGLGDPALDERGPWYHEMQHLGYNYRITDFQCALGSSQLSRLDEFVRKRRTIVDAYNTAFGSLRCVRIPGLRNLADRDLISWHLYTLQIDFESLETTRSEFMSSLRACGVGSQVLYIPVHLQPWYRKQFGYGKGKCPSAESLYCRSLSLPLFPSMTDSEVALVIEAVQQIVGRDESRCG